jgi:hypothetical protein
MRIDEHRITKAALGIEGEHDAARGEVAPDHSLHADRERDLLVLKSLVSPIRDRAIREE